MNELGPGARLDDCHSKEAGGVITFSPSFRDRRKWVDWIRGLDWMTTLRVWVLNLFVIPGKQAESYHFPTGSKDNNNTL